MKLCKTMYREFLDCKRSGMTKWSTVVIKFTTLFSTVARDTIKNGKGTGMKRSTGVSGFNSPRSLTADVPNR